jgi:MGT family glycosyltransferase
VSRYLFVVPPITGHILPTIEVAKELVARGHDVAWASYGIVDELIPEWGRLITVADSPSLEVIAATAEATTKAQGGMTAFRSVWEDYMGPVARQMLPGVEAAVDEFAPDVMVVDQQTVAGAVVAQKRKIPWATSATTSSELIARYGRGDVDPYLLAYYMKLAEWLQGFMRELLLDLGMPKREARVFEPRFSRELVLAYTTTEFMGVPMNLPPTIELVGPAIGTRFFEADFPWEWLDKTRPLVLVSLGTVNWRGGAKYFAAAAEVLGEMDVQGVLVCPEELVPDPPPNVHVQEKIPQVELLERATAVVTHAGHNTVVESLCEGLPMVVSPIRDDQPIVADQVVRAGAGVLVKFNRVTPAKLRTALEAVLHEDRYRQAAERVRDSFEAAGGPPVAADRLEALLAARVARAAGTSGAA